MRNILIVLCIMVAFPAMADEYLGKLSENPYNPDSTSNEYGQPQQPLRRGLVDLR